jgi:hypothetical protein
MLKKKTIHYLAVLAICLIGIFAPTDFSTVGNVEERKLQLDHADAPASGMTRVSEIVSLVALRWLASVTLIMPALDWYQHLHHAPN